MTMQPSDTGSSALSPGALVDPVLARALAWDRVGRWTDAAALLRATLPATDDDPRLEAELLLALARMFNGQDFLQAPHRVEEKAAVLSRVEAIAEQLADPLMLAEVLHERALDLHVRYFHGDGDVAAEEACLRRARDLRREHGDAVGAAWSHFYLGTMQQVMEQDHAAAQETFEQAYAMVSELDDEPILRSYVVRHLGQMHQVRGELDAARERLEESLRLREQAGWYAGTLAAHHSLGALHRAAGDLDRAREHLERAREVGERIDARFMLGVVEREIDALQA